jgi:AGZA family xanthine/uracil permease-like MFS transporter
MEAMIGILLWIGIIITAQAFQEVPKKHSLAVALGLIPALASWALLLVNMALEKAGTNLFEAAPRFGNDLFIYGIISLSQGFMLTCMVLSSMMVFVIERQFVKAAMWMLAGSAMAYFGLMHGYRLDQQAGVVNHLAPGAANHFALMYLVAAGVLVLLHFYNRARETKGH